MAKIDMEQLLNNTAMMSNYWTMDPTEASTKAPEIKHFPITIVCLASLLMISMIISYVLCLTIKRPCEIDPESPYYDASAETPTRTNRSPYDNIVFVNSAAARQYSTLY